VEQVERKVHQGAFLALMEEHLLSQVLHLLAAVVVLDMALLLE
jgi:hypothetical protein